MNIPEFSVKHSLFVNILTVFVVVAGLSSLLSLKREAFPPVSFDTVIVTTHFRGASAEKVERLVTTPLEKELKEVDNIEEMVSTSNDGLSKIMLKIAAGVKNKDKVVRDIQKAVDRVTDLPEDVDERPQVKEVTSGQIPVIKVALSGRLSEFELRRLADNLRDALLDIEGVAAVDRWGWRDEEYWVEPDLEKMRRWHVSFSEIALSLRRQNIDAPVGKVKNSQTEETVRLKTDFRRQEDIENSIIRANDLGNWLRIKDIARVRHTFEDDIIINKVLSTRAITLVVIKREGGDIIKVVRQVLARVKEFKKESPPALKVSTFYDMSYYVRRRLGVLRSNGFIGFVLVVGVLFLFLHPVPAVMTALGIPVAMLATLFIMECLGLTVNLVTMFGLIIVLGMIVDDGIIISENTYRYMERGLSPKEAAVKGASEVMLPVLSTVFTTIAAFLPLMFMQGLLGKFVRYIPMVVIIALLSSLLEAFVILPSHLADFAHSFDKGKGGKSEKAWFKKILLFYERILRAAIRRRYRVAGGVVAAFLLALLAAKFFLPFVLFSSKGVEQFMVKLEAKEGVSLEKTNSLIKPVEVLVSRLPSKYLDTYSTIVGNIKEERGFDPNEKIGSNYAMINVYLTPSGKRGKTAAQIMDMIRPQMERLYERLKKEGVKKLYMQGFKEGPPVGRDIDVRVRGESLEILRRIAGKIKQYLIRIKGVNSISSSYSRGYNQIEVVVDENKAASCYLDNAEIAFALRCAFGGTVATVIRRSKAEKEIRVLVRLSPSLRADKKVFDKIVVYNKFGNIVPLKAVASLRETKALSNLKHLNGKRFIAVTANVDNRYITSLAANRILRRRLKTLKLPPGYQIELGGENKETRRSLVSLLRSFMIAAIVIFLILATQFNSLSQPFIVMTAIPFSLIGVVFAFLVHREPLGFLAVLGLVGLCGVVVNDSIVLVDFINRLKKENPSRPASEIVIRGGLLRLRPVLLTTITTIAGIGTVAYGIGGLDPFLRPMALAISWGLLFSTFLTLILIPVLYIILEDVKHKNRLLGCKA